MSNVKRHWGIANKNLMKSSDPNIIKPLGFFMTKGGSSLEILMAKKRFNIQLSKSDRVSS